MHHRIKEIEEEIRRLTEEKWILLSRTPAKCYHCGHEEEIRNLTYLQRMWYEAPHGCTGGDIWHHGDGEWTCPSCKKIVRLIDCSCVNGGKPINPQHDLLPKLKYHFAEIREVYPS